MMGKAPFMARGLRIWTTLPLVTTSYRPTLLDIYVKIINVLAENQPMHVMSVGVACWRNCAVMEKCHVPTLWHDYIYVTYMMPLLHK